MSASKVKPPFAAPADIRWSTEPPTQPGWYWFKSGLAIRELLFEVRLIDDELRMLKFYEDLPVVNAKGSWRGPLGAFFGPCYE